MSRQAKHGLYKKRNKAVYNAVKENGPCTFEAIERKVFSSRDGISMSLQHQIRTGRIAVDRRYIDPIYTVIKKQ